MYKILLSHRLGLDETDIRVAHSDTDLAPDGGGTYASRTAVLGGSAATIAADKILAKARKIAAHTLEAAEDDIEFADGIFCVVGTDRAVSLKDVAQAAYVPSRLPPGLETGLYEGRPRSRTSPTAAMSAKLRSIPRPVPPGCCAMSSSTMSVRSSTRSPLLAKSLARHRRGANTMMGWSSALISNFLSASYREYDAPQQARTGYL